MSKIGTKKITYSSGVSLTVSGSDVSVKGPQGETKIAVPAVLEVVKGESDLEVKRKNEDKKTKSLHGLYRQLIANAVVGVEKPWEKRLEIVGTGYNVKLQGEDLLIKVGYSHPVVFKKQEGIKYKVEGNNKIVVFGVDKQKVGEVAYQIKLIKKPDSYKGKGIKFADEKLRIKPGKKAKTAGPAA